MKKTALVFFFFFFFKGVFCQEVIINNSLSGIPLDVELSQPEYDSWKKIRDTWMKKSYLPVKKRTGST